jgi:hypothetical protein
MSLSSSEGMSASLQNIDYDYRLVQGLDGNYYPPHWPQAIEALAATAGPGLTAGSQYPRTFPTTSSSSGNARNFRVAKVSRRCRYNGLGCSVSYKYEKRLLEHEQVST